MVTQCCRAGTQLRPAAPSDGSTCTLGPGHSLCHQFVIEMYRFQSIVTYKHSFDPHCHVVRWRLLFVCFVLFLQMGKLRPTVIQ